MVTDTEVHRAAFADAYSDPDSRWHFHYTDDPLTRYLRDRRLDRALRILSDNTQLDMATQRVLVVCGGVGGEGTYLRKAGFADVTVSDFSPEALERCRRFDPLLKTLLIDAEGMDLPDSSYDIVLAQDGLHHLPRPAVGLTEMLRVARQAVVVIEPHTGLVARIAGTEWEVQGQAVNYVFRWNRLLLEQCTRSFLLSQGAKVVVNRIWDHGSLVSRAVAQLPYGLRLPAAKVVYASLRYASRAGNMMIGVVIKDAEAAPERLVGH